MSNVTGTIAPELTGIDTLDHRGVDARLRDLDGTEHKSRLGANAILGVSLACAAGAAFRSTATSEASVPSPSPCPRSTS